MAVHSLSYLYSIRYATNSLTYTLKLNDDVYDIYAETSDQLVKSGKMLTCIGLLMAKRINDYILSCKRNGTHEWNYPHPITVVLLYEASPNLKDSINLQRITGILDDTHIYLLLNLSEDSFLNNEKGFRGDVNYLANTIASKLRTLMAQYLTLDFAFKKLSIYDSLIYPAIGTSRNSLFVAELTVNLSDKKVEEELLKEANKKKKELEDAIEYAKKKCPLIEKFWDGSITEEMYKYKTYADLDTFLAPLYDKLEYLPMIDKDGNFTGEIKRNIMVINAIEYTDRYNDNSIYEKIRKYKAKLYIENAHKLLEQLALKRESKYNENKAFISGCSLSTKLQVDNILNYMEKFNNVIEMNDLSEAPMFFISMANEVLRRLNIETSKDITKIINDAVIKLRTSNNRVRSLKVDLKYPYNTTVIQLLLQLRLINPGGFVFNLLKSMDLSYPVNFGLGFINKTCKHLHPEDGCDCEYENFGKTLFTIKRNLKNFIPGELVDYTYNYERIDDIDWIHTGYRYSNLSLDIRTSLEKIHPGVLKFLTDIYDIIIKHGGKKFHIETAYDFKESNDEQRVNTTFMALYDETDVKEELLLYIDENEEVYDKIIEYVNRYN